MMNNIRRFTAIITSAIIAVSCMIIKPQNTAEAVQYDMNARAEELLVLVNEARAEKGIAPLYMVDHLNDIANVRARELIFDYRHSKSDGGTVLNMLDKNRVPYTNFAENIACKNSTAEEIHSVLMNSKDHCTNIMNPSFTHVGIGVTYDQNSMYGWYWSQVFFAVNEDIAGQKMITREDLTPSTEEEFEEDQIVPKTCGDVNGDSKVNSYDAIALVKYCFGDYHLTALQLEASDIAKDGMVNLADVVVMRKHIIGYEEYKVIPYVFETA